MRNEILQPIRECVRFVPQDNYEKTLPWHEVALILGHLTFDRLPKKKHGINPITKRANASVNQQRAMMFRTMLANMLGIETNHAAWRQRRFCMDDVRTVAKQWRKHAPLKVVYEDPNAMVKVRVQAAASCKEMGWPRPPKVMEERIEVYGRMIVEKKRLLTLA